MGLDQWLNRRKADGEIVEEIYWRKANFIHRYFTEYSDLDFIKSDNCTEFTVSVADLKRIKAMCEEILEFNAQPWELLPTMSGFFFGSTAYDDWYFEDVKYTKIEVEKLLNERPLKEGEEFFYYAWY